MLTDVMSSVVLASQKEAMPAGPGRGTGRSHPMGAEAFGHTLRRILSPDGEETADKAVDSQIVSDDELRDETLSHSSHGQEAINLPYLGYVYALGLEVPGKPALEAVAEVEASAGGLAEGIALDYGGLSEGKQDISTALQDVLPPGLEAGHHGLPGESYPLGEAGDAAVLASAGPSHGTTAVSVADAADTRRAGWQGRNAVTAGLGGVPPGAWEMPLASTAVAPTGPIQPGSGSPNAARSQLLRGSQTGSAKLRDALGATRLSPPERDGPAMVELLQAETRADEPSISAESTQDVLSAFAVEETLAGDGALPGAEDPLMEALAKARSSMEASAANRDRFGTQDTLQDGEITNSALNANLEAAVAQDQIRSPSPGVGSTASPEAAAMYAEANSEISTGDAVEGSAQGQLAYFIPDPGDLLGYEVTAEGPAGPPSAGYSEGERAGSKTAAPSSRGTEGSSLARENALQGTPASPEANAADSAQEEVDGTMPVDGDGDGLQDGASAGSEMEAGRQGPESRGDSLQGIDGQDVQGSGPLGLSSQAAQADAVSQELTQAASLRPQHPAQGTAVNPNQVIEQIVRGVELNVRGENGEIRLQLKPESLGEVEVRIATNNGIVSAAFIAESQRVKSLIEAGLPQLKQQLMEQGLNIQGLSVQVGGGSTYGRDAYPSGSQTASASGIWRQGGSGLVHRTAGSTQARQNRWGNTIDYRV